MNESPTLHPSRSYKRGVGRCSMTGGRVATLAGLTNITNKLQPRQTLSTNYTEHIRLSYFPSEHNTHRRTPTYILSSKNTQHSVSTAPTAMRPFPIPLPIVHQHQIETTATASSTEYTHHALWIHYTTTTNSHRQYVSHEQT